MANSSCSLTSIVSNSDESPVQSNSVSPTNNRPKSNVWGYFSKKGDRKVSCCLCSKNYTYHGGTSNLQDHLTCFHLKEYQQSNSLSQATIRLFLPRSKCSDGRTKEVTARDLCPMNSVEGQGFLNLMKCIEEPGNKVPFASHISELVKKKYVAANNRFKEILNNHSRLAITTDIWTSSSNDAYISVVGHFIDNYWQMVSCIFGTCPFHGTHTAVNISEKLLQVIEEYQLDMGSVTAVVHDQASNMEAGGHILESDWETGSLKCSAHCLQLCVNEGLQLVHIV